MLSENYLLKNIEKRRTLRCKTTWMNSNSLNYRRMSHIWCYTCIFTLEFHFLNTTSFKSLLGLLQTGRRHEYTNISENKQLIIRCTFYSVFVYFIYLRGVRITGAGLVLETITSHTEVVNLDNNTTLHINYCNVGLSVSSVSKASSTTTPLNSLLLLLTRTGLINADDK